MKVLVLFMTKTYFTFCWRIASQWMMFWFLGIMLRRNFDWWMVSLYLLKLHCTVHFFTWSRNLTASKILEFENKIMEGVAVRCEHGHEVHRLHGNPVWRENAWFFNPLLARVHDLGRVHRAVSPVYKPTASYQIRLMQSTTFFKTLRHLRKEALSLWAVHTWSWKNIYRKNSHSSHAEILDEYGVRSFFVRIYDLPIRQESSQPLAISDGTSRAAEPFESAGSLADPSHFLQTRLYGSQDVSTNVPPYQAWRLS